MFVMSRTFRKTQRFPGCRPESLLFLFGEGFDGIIDIKCYELADELVFKDCKAEISLERRGKSKSKSKGLRKQREKAKEVKISKAYETKTSKSKIQKGRKVIE